MNYYIHVPFCASKCGYCAFYSEAECDPGSHRLYLDHLQKQLDGTVLPPGETLYVGGGTPTLLNTANLERFIGILRRCIPLQPDAEISIEANPETLTAAKVELLRTFFNRISVGVQSFEPHFRERIGRRCSQEALVNALELIRSAQFPHWNCDLIYSLPGQTVDDWKKELHQVAGSGVDHVSCYALTPEENAAMGAEFSEDDEREAEMFAVAEKVLSGYGINRYEISNYAAANGRCRHNCNVWRGGLLRGFGPSAAGFDGSVRNIEVESLSRWLAGVPPESDELPPEKRLDEIFAVNLRSVDGWTPKLWSQVPGADSWAKRLEIAEKLVKIFPGALTVEQESIKLSAIGLLYWNNIAEEII